MSDPVVEAVRRSVKWIGAGLVNTSPGSVAEFAAREMAKPIRELHKPLTVMCIASDCATEICDHEDECPADFPVIVCAHCWEIAEAANRYQGEEGIHETVEWPCATAKVIYPSEELER